MTSKYKIRCTNDELYPVYEKLKEIYEAQEKHYNLMADFEKMMRALAKEHNKPYPNLHQVIGTYGDGIENVDLAMAEFEQQMRYVGFSLEEEEEEQEIER